MASDQNYFTYAQKDGDGDHQQWVLGDLDSQWCMAYRIRNVSGEPAVCELRVLPGSVSDYKDAVETKKEPGRPIDDVPQGGIKSRMIRKLKPDEARREALRFWQVITHQSGDQAVDVLGRRGYSLDAISGVSPQTKGGRRRAKTDRDYAVIGAAHETLNIRGSQKPNVELADLLTKPGAKIKPEQVRDWLHEARRRGIVRRQPTWGLTEKGKKLLDERSHDET